MIKKYSAIKNIKVNGEIIKPGEEVKGLKQRILNALVEHGKIEIEYIPEAIEEATVTREEPIPEEEEIKKADENAYKKPTPKKVKSKK